MRALDSHVLKLEEQLQTFEKLLKDPKFKPYQAKHQGYIKNVTETLLRVKTLQEKLQLAFVSEESTPLVSYPTLKLDVDRMIHECTEVEKVVDGYTSDLFSPSDKGFDDDPFGDKYIEKLRQERIQDEYDSGDELEPKVPKDPFQRKKFFMKETGKYYLESVQLHIDYQQNILDKDTGAVRLREELKSNITHLKAYIDDFTRYLRYIENIDNSNDLIIAEKSIEINDTRVGILMKKCEEVESHATIDLREFTKNGEKLTGRKRVIDNLYTRPEDADRSVVDPPPTNLLENGTKPAAIKTNPSASVAKSGKNKPPGKQTNPGTTKSEPPKTGVALVPSNTAAAPSESQAKTSAEVAPDPDVDKADFKAKMPWHAGDSNSIVFSDEDEDNSWDLQIAK